MPQPILLQVAQRIAGPTVLASALAIAALGSLVVPHGSARPALRLPAVPTDADDCAIWTHPTDPAKSRVVGNDKDGPGRGLYVYDLKANVLQFVPVDRPSNPDVRCGLALANKSVDICAVLERSTDRIRVFAIDPSSGLLRDVSAPEGIRTGFGHHEAYGFALYRRPSDGAVFAFVSHRHRGDIRQFRLVDNGHGRVRGLAVRSFGGAHIRDRVEGMVADDELGFLYACDEDYAVLKFHADPKRGDGLAGRFATGDGIQGDREGIAIYKCTDRTGYIVLSSQYDGTVKIYEREAGNRFLKTVHTLGSSLTDGLDVTSCAAGPRFPCGFLACHDHAGKQFVLYAWQDVAGTDLKVRYAHAPTRAHHKLAVAQTGSDTCRP